MNTKIGIEKYKYINAYMLTYIMLIYSTLWSAHVTCAYFLSTPMCTPNSSITHPYTYL